MRTISSTLEAAQSAGGTPYIKLLFYDADDGLVANYSSEGASMAAIEHHEEAYNDYATIWIKNAAGGVPDLRGCWTEIGYGFVTGAGNEYSSTARLWVKHQQEISAEGQKIVILELEGMWSVLNENTLYIGNPPFFNPEYRTDTIYNLIDIILGQYGFTLAALGNQNDLIINDYTPEFQINAQPFERAGFVIYNRLLRMTRCYLRAKASKIFEIRYPRESDATDETYQSDAVHYFYEYVNRKNIMVPNHILVVANAGPDGMYTDYVIGEAKDQTEIDRYGWDVIQLELAPDLIKQIDAERRADALLSRVKGEAMSARLVVPHDCRTEICDKVTVVDNR